MNGVNGTEEREWVDYEIPVPWGIVSGKLHNHNHRNNQ